MAKTKKRVQTQIPTTSPMEAEKIPDRPSRPQTLDVPAPLWQEEEANMSSSLEGEVDDLYSEAEESLEEEEEPPLPPAPQKKAQKKGQGKRRWDRPAPATSGAEEVESETDGESGKHPAQKKLHFDDPLPPAQKISTIIGSSHLRYKSWRRWKHPILECLRDSGGNTAFVRRYMLFKHGVSVPPGVIRYYNSCRR